MRPLAEFPQIELAFSIGASIIVLLSLIPYLRGVLAGTTKPHAISWLLWSIVSGVCAFAQLQDGGGSGTVVPVTGAGFSLVIFAVALAKGTRDVRPLDWACLLISVAALGAWTVLKSPEASVLLLASINVIAFVPTVRKSVKRPDQESLWPYAAAVLGGVASVTTMASLSIVSSTWGLVGLTTNGFFVLCVLVCRNNATSRVPKADVEVPVLAYATPLGLQANEQAA